MSPLILASGSPRRKHLLRILAPSFEVHISRVNEDFNEEDTLPDIVQMLALRKATEVASRHAGACIIGADTLVVHQNRILGKPQSPEEAISMLERLSGDSHHVFTGVALLKTDEKGIIQQKKIFFEKTKVIFGQPDKADIERYVAGGSPMDKAGAYGIQDDWGATFVKRIEGDYYNIVGLPLYALYHHLKTFAPAALKKN